MNAIILAAGLGSRFNEITKENHKALLPIGGTPNIERTIQYLHDFGIQEIYIVVGHMASLFEYLVNKYNVELIKNEHYADYNNLYSMAQALPYFSDSFVIDADVVLLENIFSKEPQSCYYTVQRKDSDEIDWCPMVENGRVKAMNITDEYIPSMLGISFWVAKDCEKIKTVINEKLKEKENVENPKLYWDNIPILLFEDIEVGVHQINEDVVDEMDTVQNYLDICEKYKSHNSIDI